MTNNPWKAIITDTHLDSGYVDGVVINTDDKKQLFFQCKLSEEDSPYNLDGGHISKLSLATEPGCPAKSWLAHYDGIFELIFDETDHDEIDQQLDFKTLDLLQALIAILTSYN